MNILENIGGQMENFAKIQSQLETIVKVQLHPNLEGYEAPKSFGIYKESGGKALGVTGDVFVPTQPSLILDSLLDCSVDLSKMTYHEMKGGAKVRFQIPLKTIEFQNARKVGDVTDVSLCVQTGFDGLTKTTMYLYTHRLICTNGAKNSKTEFEVSFKNTKGNQGKVLGLCNDVSRAVQQFDGVKDLYKALDRVQVNQEIVNEYLKKVADLDIHKSEEWKPITQNRYDAINESIALEFQRTGTTLFGLYNGITHYTNHVAKGSDSEDFIFVDNGAKLNDKALAFVSELVY